jgi:O-antigen/teichoic acid export membrane protein
MPHQPNSWSRALSHFRRFSVNASLQIGSQVLPLVAGAVAIPLVYKNIARSDFGVFTVALSMLGLFSLLDLGLGRATVRFMARAFAIGDTVGAASVVSHSAILLGGFSWVACIVLLFTVPLIAGHWFQTSAVNQATLRGSLYILAAALPLAGLTSMFRAVLESRERFLIISIIQVILGVSTYFVPWLLSVFTRDVRWLIAGAVACRGFAFVAFLVGAISVWQGSFPWREIKGRGQREFHNFSLWLVISNIVGTVIAYGDRAILVRMFGLSEIAFYNIPFELLGRLMIIVNSAATVVFPALSRTASDDPRFEDLYISLTTLLGALMGIVFLAISMLTASALHLWLGDEFRIHSTTLIQVLLVGLAFQTLNVFALATLNARGFARPITIMHLLETPAYFWALYFFGKRFGLTGVACVWSARWIVEYMCFVGFQISIGMAGRTGRRIVGSVIAASNAISLVIFAALKNGPAAIAVGGLCAAGSLLWARSTFGVESRQCSK